MKRENAIRLFNEKQVRVHWDSEQEKWYFSIVDVIGVLTDSLNPRKYWSVLKTRLKKESSQLATNCSQLKMQSSVGKYYNTDVGDTEQILRLIQSIPSPKAEPFKQWLAKVGYEIINSGNIMISPMGCTQICCDSDFAEDLSQLFPKMTEYYGKGDELIFEGQGEIICTL